MMDLFGGTWRRAVIRYLVGVLAGVLAAWLRIALLPVMGNSAPYVLLFSVSVVVAVSLGTGPGLAAVAIGAWAGETYLIEPIGTWQLNWASGLRMAMILAGAVYVGHVGRRLREARRQAREEAVALRESEARYRSLFENMLDGYAWCEMIFDAEGRPVDFVYREVNAAFGRITGLQNVVGKRIGELAPGIRERDPEILEIFGRVVLSGRAERFERESKALGMRLYVSVYSPRRNEFVAVFENAAERRKDGPPAALTP